MQSDKAESAEAKGAEEKEPSNVGDEMPKPKGISAVAVLWTFGKCLGALLPVYLAGYYRVSTSLLVFGMMVYTGWKHAREAKEERLRSAIRLFTTEEDYTSTKVSKIKRDLPAWVRSKYGQLAVIRHLPSPSVTSCNLTCYLKHQILDIKIIKSIHGCVTALTVK